MRRRPVVRSGAEAARRGGKRAVIDPLGGIPDEPAPEPEPQRIQRPPRPTTWALLIVLGVAFLAEALVGRDPAVENSVALFRLGALYAPAVRDGDIWRIGSYALLHIGWVHLLVNAYALWILAPQLEITFGSNQTLGLFCATAIAGGGASALWSAYSGSARLAAGASGGIFGLFGATVALYFRVRKGLPEPVRRGIIRAIALRSGGLPRREAPSANVAGPRSRGAGPVAPGADATGHCIPAGHRRSTSATRGPAAADRSWRGRRPHRRADLAAASFVGGGDGVRRLRGSRRKQDSRDRIRLRRRRLPGCGGGGDGRPDRPHRPPSPLKVKPVFARLRW
ncbi:MAG: rhomboid family intramembrane serine protease [Deltaproteobacteria bacterium]|nr:MAG: rhomboid family intramembrane serine protease [Deltaproteobacteria bacterium]